MAASRATGVPLREWYTGLFTALSTRSIRTLYPDMVDDTTAAAAKAAKGGGGVGNKGRSPSPHK
jgi:hypothetical protein